MSWDRSAANPPVMQSLKAGTKALIRAFGGQEAAAAECGKSQGHMSRYGVPHTNDFMPIDDVLRLEACTHGQAGHPHVTRVLAREAGYVLVRAAPESVAPGEWHKAIGIIPKEVGEVVELVCDALCDAETPGAVTRREVEAKNIVGNIDEAIEKLFALRALAVTAPEGD